MLGRALALLLMSADPAGSTQASPVVSRWQVDFGEHRCTASPTTASPEVLTFVVRTEPSDQMFELLFVSAAWTKRQVKVGEGGRLDLAPEGELQVQLADIALSHEAGRAIATTLDPQMLERLRRASAVRLAYRNKVLAAMPLPGMVKVLATLEECRAEWRRRHDLDEARFAGWKRRAELVTSSMEDANKAYPPQAIKADLQGVVPIIVTIGIEGDVTDCVAIDNGVAEVLRMATCGFFRKRVRFVPALDASGTPVVDKKALRFRWALGAATARPLMLN